MNSRTYIILFIFICTNIFSQSFDIKKFTVEDGLFSNDIEYVFQDAKGVLWIKCGKGICSYDGKKITKYSDRYAISGDRSFVETQGRIDFPSYKGVTYVKDGRLEREAIDSSLCIMVDKEKEAIRVGNHFINNKGYHVFFFGFEDSIKIFKNGVTKRLSLKKQIESYGKKNILADNNNELWVVFENSKLNKTHLFKLNGSGLEDQKIDIPLGNISGIYTQNNNRILFANNKEVVLLANKHKFHFKIPPEYFTEYYSDNLLCDNHNDFWMPYTKGLFKINENGIVAIENKSRKTFCDSVRMISYDGNGNESSITEYKCQDLLFGNGITKLQTGEIVTGNELFIKNKFFKIFPEESNLVINSVIVDFENQIWYGTNQGLFKCNLSTLEQTKEVIMPLSGIKEQTTIKHFGKEVLKISKFYLYDKNEISDSLEIKTKSNEQDDTWANRSGYKYGKKLKNGSLLIYRDYFYLYHDNKLEMPSLENLQKGKLALKRKKSNSTGAIFEAGSIFLKDDWLFFNLGDYYYKTDGKSVFCYGQEIGITDSIISFVPISRPQNDDTIDEVFMATKNKLYLLKNDKLNIVPCSDLLEGSISDIVTIHNSNNNLFFLRKQFNSETKVYSYDNQIITSIKVNNPQNISFIDFNTIIKTNQTDKYFFNNRQGIFGLISFNNKIPELIKFHSPPELISLYDNSIQLVGDKLLILPLFEPMKICQLDFKENKVVKNKTYYKFNNFEATEVNKRGNTIYFDYYTASGKDFYAGPEYDFIIKLYKIDLSKEIFNPYESKTSIESIKYINSTDTFHYFNKNNILVPHSFNPLEIHYKGICLSDGSKLSYRYKLEGIDDSWHETSEDFVSYSTLPSGDYTFKVISCNNDALWNKNPISISFTILPPWNRTWWAYCMYVLAGFAAIRGYLKNRTKKLEKEKQKLEKTVEERTAEVIEQKHLIEEKNKEITDSINYAQKIQHTLLASKQLLDTNLKDYFVLFKPKDIVSGDFYWAAKHDKGFIIITADCTGHGVPGAFMSLLSISYLNEITKEQKITQPDKVFNVLRDKIITNFNSDNSEPERKDGMDAVICNYDFKNSVMQFAAANNPVWLVRNGKIIEYKGDKMPVGLAAVEHKPFTLQSIDFQKGDIVYTLTDGYADQFGGPNGKKFMYKQMKKLIESVSAFPMSDQKSKLESEINSWKGNTEQVDDILLIGVKIG